MQTRNQLIRSNSSYAYAFDTISVQAILPPLAFDLPHSHSTGRSAACAPATATSSAADPRRRRFIRI